jgi:hypothetical protein
VPHAETRTQNGEHHLMKSWHKKQKRHGNKKEKEKEKEIYAHSNT